MAGILVGIPSAHPDERFLASLPLFLSQLRQVRPDTQDFVVKNQPIADAYNRIAHVAIEAGADRLLTLEDDHWGFTVEMVEQMLATGHPLVSIPYYSRHYPYQLTAFDRRISASGLPRCIESRFKSGAHEVDITGLGMVLFDMSIFRRLPPPWFVGMPLAAKEVQQVLFGRCRTELGIRPLALFDHILPHGDLTRENILAFREQKARNDDPFARRIRAWHQSQNLTQLQKREQSLSEVVINS